MATELGLLSSTKVRSLAQSQQQPQLNPSSTTGGQWMWNPKEAAQEDEDSWEERAFEEDSSNVTWPPRSYTCTFCRREFRSAQALGGHMNIHRRDRARLHQMLPPGSSNPTSTAGISTASSTLLIPRQESVANGGLCFLYTLPNPTGVFTSTAMNICLESMDSTSNVLPISTPCPVDNLISAYPPSVNFAVTPLSINSSVSHSSNPKPSPSFSNDNNHDNSSNKKDSGTEELDLELRLGRGSASPT